MNENTEFETNLKTLENIKRVYEKLMEEEVLYSQSDLENFYSTFNDEFGPIALKRYEGRELLSKLHDFRNNDSLVYWLEYKSDDQFPYIFGSVSGGSSLKYRIYWRKETGKWTTGSSQRQISISEEDALKEAEKHRFELIKGYEIIKELPDNATLKDYIEVQKKIENELPLLGNRVWVHKYYSLLFPDKLIGLHSKFFQKFYLIKLLIKYRQINGNFYRSWYYKQLQKILNIHMNHFAHVLYHIYGGPQRYRLIQIKNSSNPQEFYDSMIKNSCIAMPYSEIGDLRLYKGKNRTERKNKIQNDLIPKYMEVKTQRIISQELIDFLEKVKERNIFLVANGEKIIATGIINEGSEYDYIEEESKYPHQYKIFWRDKTEWNLPGIATKRTLIEIKKIDHLIEIEKHILNLSEIDNKGRITIITPEQKELSDLPEIQKHIKNALDRKSNVIIYGPPGTGKTYWAEKTACELFARKFFKKLFDQLSKQERSKILGNYKVENSSITRKMSAERGFVRICCFHPAFGYEDFIEGYRAKTNERGELLFELEKGIFSEICQDAIDDEDHDYYLVIDEINRGDIPRIFGEVMLVLEKNKRNKPVILSVSKDPFIIPDNLFIIATMNTANRSIALLDLALRRRFGFIEIMPDSSLLDQLIDDFHIGVWLDNLNSAIINNFANDGRNLQIGHSYFMEKKGVIKSFSKFRKILKEDIFPLLEEYCYDDFSLLKKFFDDSLIDEENKTIHWENFEDFDNEKLKRALLTKFPASSTEKRLVTSEKPDDDDEEDEDSDKTEDVT